ncbi:transcription termination/antitermination protein NusG [Colwelliaceae bacterium 6471]
MNLHWYAIYTKHNAEQTLQQCITNYSERYALNYETYLPLREHVTKWRDRNSIKKLPLFRNYLFVKHDDNGFYKIKTMKGFCDYIRFGSNPSTIPSKQMEIIQKVVAHQAGKYCQSSSFVKGKKVKICRGPLAGYEGVLQEEQHSNMLAIEVKSLKLFLNVHVAVTDVVLV